VDVSDKALGLLAAEARRRGIGKAMTLVHADLGSWRPRPGGYSLVLCTGYWDRLLFAPAAAAVAPGGLLAWRRSPRRRCACVLAYAPSGAWSPVSPPSCCRPGSPFSASPGSPINPAAPGNGSWPGTDPEQPAVDSRSTRQRLLARHGP